jgi:2'-5' RNA ligase
MNLDAVLGGQVRGGLATCNHRANSVAACAVGVMVLLVTSLSGQSGLIVDVPEAEPAVGRYRERLDVSASLGVPAHITVLFPFVPATEVDSGVLDQLRRLFAGISGFSFRLERTDWFGDDVLWLAPDDPGPFRALTQRAYQAFPAFAPYQGQFDDVVPHLTVGRGHPLGELRAAEEAVRADLPIEARVGAVTLVTQQPIGERWTKAAVFDLA